MKNGIEKPPAPSGAGGKQHEERRNSAPAAGVEPREGTLGPSF
jgi:hypothetical protein